MKTILLVEDNPDDIFITQNACRRTGLPHRFVFVSDGEAAIDYLAGSREFANRIEHPFPDLMFLDLKLPKRSGHEVLKWARQQPGLTTLPIIMLTSSQEVSDINSAYKLGVTSYLHKQANIVEFSQGVRVIMKYWFELNIPPTLGAAMV